MTRSVWPSVSGWSDVDIVCRIPSDWNAGAKIFASNRLLALRSLRRKMSLREGLFTGGMWKHTSRHPVYIKWGLSRKHEVHRFLPLKVFSSSWLQVKPIMKKMIDLCVVCIIARRLRCIVALRDSASAAVISLQRILSNENAKLKVKGKLQLTPYAMHLYSSTKVRWLLL